jgi:hypothetical protein
MDSRFHALIPAIASVSNSFSLKYGRTGSYTSSAA